MKKKKAQDAPTKEQIAEMTKLCERYMSTMEDIKENKRQLKTLITQNKMCKTSFEIDLINDDIARLKKTIQKEEEDTSYVRWALFYLDDKARSVMKQLYFEGYCWDSIVDSDDYPISAGTVGRIRKKSLYDMAARVARKQKEMEEKATAAKRVTEENHTAADIRDCSSATKPVDQRCAEETTGCENKVAAPKASNAQERSKISLTEGKPLKA